MASHFYWLIVGILIVWRFTHLFYGEDGPWDVLVRFRKAVGEGFWGSLLDCFYCLSLWVALPFAYLLASNWKERLLLWPALSGGAILIERLTSKPQPHPTMDYREYEESDDVLRQQASAIEDHDTHPAAK